MYRLSDHLFDNASRRVGPMAAPDKWGAPPDLAPATRRFFVQLADTAARRWQEKDQGIWEIRGEPRDFLYSKLMCWVALDRAVALADRLDASDRVEAWKQTRDQIREAILTKGWSDRANAFTQSFGSDDLDASNLMLPLVGFLPADDPRVLATIDATEERLTDERGLVYRYRSHDGLEGDEGTFLLCTFWLAQALARAGQPARARTVFERAAAFVNDVGLLAEEVDPGSGELLGNFPQAFSHIGLVNAAWAISESELRQHGHRGERAATPGSVERSHGDGARQRFGRSRPRIRLELTSDPVRARKPMASRGILRPDRFEPGGHMRSDIREGGTFPDYELADQSGRRRSLSELQGGNPMVLHLSRGGFDPKEHQFVRQLVDAYPDFPKCLHATGPHLHRQSAEHQ